MSQLHVGLGRSFLAEPRAAVLEAVTAAQRTLGGRTPGLAFFTATVEHSAPALWHALRQALPETPLHGITTSLGLLGKDGVLSGPDGVVGVMLLAGDGPVRFAVGYSDISGDDDGRSSGRAAAQQIVAQGRGEKPALLLFNAAPGQEEGLLAGVAEVLPDVPAYGGSAADHAIAGEWSVFTDGGARKNAISIAALFGPIAVGGALIAPYKPAGPTAVVTRGSGRTLAELDGKPAAQVLNGWIDGRLEYQLAQGGNILAQTALRPLARRYETPLGPHYVTLHAAHVHVPGHEIDLFAGIQQGGELCLMEGSAEGLIDVVGELVQTALRESGLRKDQVRGGVLIYCAGCAGAVGPSLDEGLRRHLAPALSDVPILGMCTFGEQGFVRGLGNVHQNISVSLVLIGG